MPIPELTDADLGQISLQDLEAFLLRAGWVRFGDRARVSQWRTLRNETDLQVVLPRTLELGDALVLLREALPAIAFAQSRTVAEVYSDIVARGADVISVRLTPDAPSGQAPLGLANATVSGLAEFVMGAASTVANPDWNVGAQRPRRAKRYARQILLTTGPGSFVVTLTMPLRDQPATDVGLVENQQVLPEFQDTVRAYGREVVHRMQQVSVRAARLADEIDAQAHPLTVFEDDPASTGNAIELGALGSIGGDDRRPYHLRYSLSPTVVTDQALPPAVQAISTAQQTVFKAAAELLRSMMPRDRQRVTGRVVRLARSHSWGPGQVVIEGQTAANVPAHRYRVELGEDQYTDALRAHQRGLDVVARGDVAIRGTHLHIDNLTDFDVVEGLPEQG